MLHRIKLNDPVPELRRFGFDCLTGEACGVGHRTLFDVDERAKGVWEGMTRTKITNRAWNKGAGSVMIPYGWYNDLLLWCLLIEAKCHTVVLLDRLIATKGDPDTIKLPHMLLGIDGESEQSELGDAVDKQTSYGYAVRRYFRQSKDPGTGLDNQHAMSGRIT